MADDYSLLISAVSDIGHWRWWSENLPEIFQIEFGGVQICVPLDNKSKPPSGLLAFRFLRPRRVRFLRRANDFNKLPEDWPRRLKEETLDPLGISYEDFAIGIGAQVDSLVAEATSEVIHFADDTGGRGVEVVFWAGTAGLHVEAAELRLITMKGVVSLAEIETLHGDWWRYWREYWEKRETPDAFPKDVACEATIPLKAKD